MIPHMTDAFRRSQAAQAPRTVRNIEITRMVQWQLYHGSEPRRAVFLAAVDASGGVMDLRLVRIWAGTVWHNRKDAVFFGQPVEAWEADAAAALEGAA